MIILCCFRFLVTNCWEWNAIELRIEFFDFVLQICKGVSTCIVYAETTALVVVESNEFVSKTKCSSTSRLDPFRNVRLVCRLQNIRCWKGSSRVWKQPLWLKRKNRAVSFIIHCAYFSIKLLAPLYIFVICLCGKFKNLLTCFEICYNSPTIFSWTNN